MAESCLFCRIANGEIPSYKIWEDENFYAFLDIFPNIRGQTLVIPKRHYQSDAFKLDDAVLAEFIKAIKKVAAVLEKGIDVGRVHMVLEGMGVNHLHAKLYPAIGLHQKEFEEVLAKQEIFFEEYPGYVSTLMGPKATEKELRALQKQILGNKS
ncbi:MAG: HIT domain-containing protein [Candidatus Micrarchaeota archaeon]|nr:HIT domain-containing protein [Candidatus Micrarchaeota archaeon]